MGRAIKLFMGRAMSYNSSTSNRAEKNILILVEEKKDNLIQSFCQIT
jgi:hypothetical protein